ncbi:MAG: hypothetical protein HYZ14_07140 [Bacteroidetes bacterium]|nr:hypothetical protein [Bacteroidota bacterium]
MKHFIPLIILYAGLSGSPVLAQPSNFTNNKYWLYQRKELLFGAGAANVLSDLGGLNRIGTDFSLADLELVMTRPSVHLGYRYRVKRMWLTKSIVQYSLLKGNDQLTNEPFRHYRNLHFRTHLIEFSQQFEFILFSNEHFGKRYKIHGLRGMKNKNTLLYLFTGAKAFIYIPQGMVNQGWTNLRPLHTEGQGLTGGPKPYRLFNFGIPFGVGLKLNLDQVWRINFEFSYTKTFTDYLDDVSSVYYDNALIEQHYGSIAAYFADPSSGEHATWTYAGEMRGDNNEKDALIYFNISFVRNLTYKRGKKLKFQYRAKF